MKRLLLPWLLILLGITPIFAQNFDLSQTELPERRDDFILIYQKISESLSKLDNNDTEESYNKEFSALNLPDLLIFSIKEYDSKYDWKSQSVHIELNYNAFKKSLLVVSDEIVIPVNSDRIISITDHYKYGVRLQKNLSKTKFDVHLTPNESGLISFETEILIFCNIEPSKSKPYYFLKNSTHIFGEPYQNNIINIDIPVKLLELWIIDKISNKILFRQPAKK